MRSSLEVFGVFLVWLFTVMIGTAIGNALYWLVLKPAFLQWYWS